ncbi:MAG: UbiX family flavin prenyltransferase [Sedimentisphaerales bacterium]|nr:UbiX family flavin prenyltransferase [Sedimentisphaerales bacterium]
MAKRIIVGIGGASGVVYARWVLKLLAEAKADIDLIISPWADGIIKDELGIPSLEPEKIAGGKVKNVHLHDSNNLAAEISSGSAGADGMIICPCSSNTLAAIASGRSENLIHRAAYVTLKQRRPLVIVHRESPLTSIDIDNMAKVTSAGGIIFPASPVFYSKPKTIDDLAAALAHRVVELVGVSLKNPHRWQGNP